MTPATSIQQQPVLQRRVYSPAVVPQPGISTFVGQAAVGGGLGAYGLVLGKILIDYRPIHGLIFYSLPFLLAIALGLGAVAGLLIGAFTRLAHGPLHLFNRSLLAVFIFALGCFLFLVFTLPPSEQVPWFVVTWMVVVPAITVGLITGSRLRVWRELVRVGEARGRMPRILAGLSGAILRVAVVFLFMEYLIPLICLVQGRVYDGRSSETEQKVLIQFALTCCHLAVSVVILFLRMRFSTLSVIAMIAAIPLFAALGEVEEMDLLVVYILLGYAGAWGMFLLTRSPAMDRAFSVLKEEFRYYLID